MKAANGARGAPSVFARVTDALCLAFISVCVAVSVAAAVFGVATVVCGYPTFGGDGYCYVGDEGVPDAVQGRTVLAFRSCDGKEARTGDTVIYDSGAGARAGVCVATDGAVQRVVLSTARGITSVPFSAVVGVAFAADESAGKFVGALADIYPASSYALFTLAAAAIAVTAISSVKRRRKTRKGEISGRNGRGGRRNASDEYGREADRTEKEDGSESGNETAYGERANGNAGDCGRSDGEEREEEP